MSVQNSGTRSGKPLLARHFDINVAHALGISRHADGRGFHCKFHPCIIGIPNGNLVQVGLGHRPLPLDALAGARSGVTPEGEREGVLDILRKGLRPSASVQVASGEV